MVRLTPVALALLLATATTATEAAGSRMFGRSAELGVAFVARGEEAWCAPTIEIDLTAAVPDAYADTDALQRMIGRIRAAVTDPKECPKAEIVFFHAFVGNDPQFSLIATRLGRWRVLEIDPATRQPRCIDTDAADPRCADRVAAFETMHQVFADAAFANIRLTEMLSVGSDAAAAWEGKTSLGRLTIHDADQAPEATADALIETLRQPCEGARGRFTAAAGPRNDKIAAAGARCRIANKTEATEVVVWQRGGACYVFTLWGQGQEAEALRTRDRLLAILPMID